MPGKTCEALGNHKLDRIASMRPQRNAGENGKTKQKKTGNPLRLQ